MFMRVASLVFLFLTRLIFPHLNSVAEVFMKRYGQNTLDCGFRLHKAQVDLQFLVNCSNNYVVPKFLNIGVATKSLKSSRTY